VSEADVDAIGLLQDPARRSLYMYVVAQGREVSRNEAAEAVGVQRTLAAFHLDRLARAGLLDVTYRRLTRRSGPGAGRPAKLYTRPRTERVVSLPPRDYALAASIFADAIERAGAESAVFAAAREQGAAAGRALAAAKSPHGVTADALECELGERGYEPYRTAGGPPQVRLRNCPFQAVAQELPVTACGMNLALLQGLLAGAGLAETHTARLDPQPGECCVAILLKQI
jgi:predicted ArsR family transcriptional regulator